MLAARCKLYRFRKMDGSSSGCLQYLLAAAKSIRNNQRLRMNLPHGRQQHAFSHSLRNLVFPLFQSERPSHPATPAIDGLYRCAHFPQQGLLVFHFH